MLTYLPVAFLLAFSSLFGLSWIVTSVDPDTARWYFFALFVVLVFTFVFCTLGLLLYLVRTRFYKRYSPRWYIFTSFKMAFFVALFLALISTLGILQLISLANIFLVITAISLFAIWAYLGKKD